MNRERAKELLPIIQAFAEGKEIQYRISGSDSWDDRAAPPDFDVHEWRIKPEAFECWVCVDNNGYPESVWQEKEYAEAEHADRTIHMREVDE